MYTERGFSSFLEFTPCDLWTAFRGRTLFVSGDSQSQVGCGKAVAELHLLSWAALSSQPACCSARPA